jgi:hypothetical protein
MKKVRSIKIKNGELVFNLASTAANDDWIRSARLLKEGKTEELQKLNDEPMYYREDSLLVKVNKAIRKSK